jgi:hypothetical protein
MENWERELIEALQEEGISADISKERVTSRWHIVEAALNSRRNSFGFTRWAVASVAVLFFALGIIFIRNRQVHQPAETLPGRHEDMAVSQVELPLDAVVNKQPFAIQGLTRKAEVGREPEAFREPEPIEELTVSIAANNQITDTTRLAETEPIYAPRSIKKKRQGGLVYLPDSNGENQNQERIVFRPAERNLNRTGSQAIFKF